MLPGGTSFKGNSRFEIVRQLGMGGMGVVYEALDRERGARVALKTLHTGDPQLLINLKQEFRALQGIEHRNLVSLLELIHDEGQWFFTMELVEGWPIIDHVRSSSGVFDLEHPFDEARLRACFAQLAEALDAIHRAGKVHRDVKPSNVLVSVEGRVVVLDFGLMTDALETRVSTSGIVGTIDYMSPEQAAGVVVGPEADLYSVGVMLYEVLTRRLPFSGAPLDVLQRKRREEPPPPHTFGEVPRDLSELCSALLRVEPRMRPTAEEILKRLGATAARLRSRRRSGSTNFVGRQRELAELDAAFEDVRRGKPVLMVVEGPSGVGKTALVRQFTQRLSGRVADLLVLEGRYYEREAVPYRALDAIMDALSRFLVRLPPDAADALLPVDANLLATLFPSLRVVESVSRGGFKLPALDPHELRERLFRAIRELFLRLSRRRSVVVVVDDVQWADPDSRAVFSEAMRGPDAPNLLSVATLRSSSDVDIERWFAFFSRVGEVRHIQLERLPPDEAQELAAALLGGDATSGAAAAIAAESEGHPLLIDALVRHAMLVADARPAALRLDEAIGATIASLDAEARRLLELVVVSGSPLTYDLAARAGKLEYSQLLRLATALKAAHLVHGARLREKDALEPYHDRVRELLLARIDAGARRARHADLARALESLEGVDPEALFLHWNLAGESERAAHHAATAAARANETLAFDRAARLYREAAERTTDPEEKRRLFVGLGEALANAGRGPESAGAFSRAVWGAPSHEALELRRKMAEQLLRSGRIADGLAVVREVLAAVDLEMPKTPRRALAGLMWNRAYLAVRGRKHVERDVAEVARALLVRIDICWSVAGVLGMVDTIRGAYFQTLHFRLALEAGERFRVARALALEAGFSATGGSFAAAHTQMLCDEARALAERIGDPWILGWTRGAAGVAAVLEGRWQAGLEQIEEAEEIFRGRCGGVAWELSTFRFFTAYALGFTGRLRELCARVPEYARAAEERGDKYGSAAQRMAVAAMSWLVVDDVATARAGVREAIGDWSREDFQVEHFWELLAETQNDLYAGDVAAAQKRVDDRWPKLVGSLLLRVQLTRLECYHLRARVALASARTDNRAAKLAEARRFANRMAREKTHWATPLAQLLQAGAAFLDGDRTRAMSDLRRATDGLERADMRLYAAAARWQLGTLVGGEEGKQLRDAAEAWMSGEGVRAPARMVRMLAPGFAE